MEQWHFVENKREYAASLLNAVLSLLPKYIRSISKGFSYMCLYMQTWAFIRLISLKYQHARIFLFCCRSG